MTDTGSKPPAKLSSRERDELLKKGIAIQPPIVIPPQEQQKQTIETTPISNNNNDNINPTQISTPQEPQQPTIISEDKEEVEEVKPTRSFLCEKCKWCDGFEPSTNEKQICRVCKCDLIFHIDVIEEEDDEAEEYSSDDEVWDAQGGAYGGDSD